MFIPKQISLFPSRYRRSHRRCSANKVFLEISHNSQENPCARVSFLIKLQGCRPKACNFIKKGALAQVFSCEFCKNFRNTFSTERLWATGSAGTDLFKVTNGNTRKMYEIYLNFTTDTRTTSVTWFWCLCC